MGKYLVVFLVAAVASYSQFIEDALRYTQSNGLISARVAGLNVAYHGLSDDMGALHYNPAGLSLIAANELSIGFGFLRNSTETQPTFANTMQDFSSNNGYLTNLGFVSPFKTNNGNGAVAISYFREANFNDNYEFSGFNETSSYIGNSVDRLRGAIDYGNIPYRLYLADTINNRISTVYDGQLLQESFVSQSGGIHNLTGGAGWDLNGQFSIGFNLTAKWGGFEYRKEYAEIDVNNVYNTFNPAFPDLQEDLSRFDMTETVLQDIFGLSGSLGMMSRIGEFMRVGVTIKFPSYYEVTEDFKVEASAEFDQSVPTNLEFSDNPPEFQATSYKINTPFIYGAGASLNALGMVFTAGVEYRDASQLEFSDATDRLMALNPVITRELVGQTRWGFGAEYDIPLVPIIARASFESLTSPYQEDVAGASMNSISLGGSVFLAENIRIDGVFRWTDFTQLRRNYGEGNESRYTFTQNPLNIGLTLTYRY